MTMLSLYGGLQKQGGLHYTSAAGELNRTRCRCEQDEAKELPPEFSFAILLASLERFLKSDLNRSVVVQLKPPAPDCLCIKIQILMFESSLDELHYSTDVWVG
jgi:hypothetical protein